MAQSGKSKGLGRGLSALLADVEDDKTGSAPSKGSGKSSARGTQLLPIEKVVPNPDQPRQDFSKSELEELTASIREKGIIQPLIVRPDPAKSGAYQIVAGERRWRAAQAASVHEVPVVVRELDDTEVLELAIIENIQRSDLNTVEEAMGYRQLMDSFGHTQEQMAKALGKSRPHISNLLRLLSLPEKVLDHVRSGKLSAGHARALVTAEDPESLANQIISGGLSVRQAEKLVKGGATPKSAGPSSKVEKDADTKAIEGDLSAQLKMRVSIDPQQGTEGGKLTIRYRNLDQLDQLLQTLSS